MVTAAHSVGRAPEALLYRLRVGLALPRGELGPRLARRQEPLLESEPTAIRVIVLTAVPCRNGDRRGDAPLLEQ